MTDRNDLRRYVNNALGREGTDALIDAMTERLWEFAWIYGVAWGDDWSDFLAMSEDKWNQILDLCN